MKLKLKLIIVFLVQMMVFCDFLLTIIALKNLKVWMEPKNCSKNWINTLDTVQIQMEPLGVVLIISPWNYPILLPIDSLIGAIAAGYIKLFNFNNV